MAETLIEPLTKGMIHLCIDMQRIFSDDGIWPLPWMKRVLPLVAEIAARRPERTIFTRFITPKRPQDMPGTWQRYYQRWENATQDQIDSALLELMPQLRSFVPPALVVDKSRYSAFTSQQLWPALTERKAEGLIITGSETDVCVLSTVLDAIDLGLRVVLVRDGICSSSDADHDCLMALYHRRYSLQIETADAAEILQQW